MMPPRPRANPAPRTTSALPVDQPRPEPSPMPMPIDDGGVDPLMISSLPSLASGADVYARQFYRNSKLPQRRYLPIVKQ